MAQRHRRATGMAAVVDVMSAEFGMLRVATGRRAAAARVSKSGGRARVASKRGAADKGKE